MPVTSDFKKQNNYYIDKLAKLTTANNLHNLEDLDATKKLLR
jgi:hypothetical protein